MSDDRTKELLKKVRRIELRTKGLSNQLFSGEYHSAFKGRGMAFSEVREYAPGDEIRTIDWNVTARTGIPHVKVFEEEREMTVMLMVDMSASDRFGTHLQTKLELITEICATISFSAAQNNDKVGLLLFTDRVEMYIPPKKGRTHTLQIIRALLDFEPASHQTDISEALRYFMNVVKKRCTAFLFSDFKDHGYDASLKMVARRHDLIGMHIVDRHELQLPKMGKVLFEDMETGQAKWVDTDKRRVREQYAQNAQERLNDLDALFKRAGIDKMRLQADESYVKPLMELFKRR